MLRTLLSTPGADPKLVTVFIDGYFEVSILSFTICTFFTLDESYIAYNVMVLGISEDMSTELTFMKL